MPDVVDDRPSARPEHAADFANRPRAVAGLVEVVDRRARHDDVEGAVVERQLAHVRGLDLDALPHPLPLRVLQRRLGAIAGEVFRLPDVDAGRAARGQSFRRADQHQPAPAADVEHALVAAPRDVVEEPLAVAHLADLAVPQHPDRHQQAGDARPDHHVREHQPHRSDRDNARPEMRGRRPPDQNPRRRDEEEIADDAGGVDAVVGFHGETISLD